MNSFDKISRADTLWEKTASQLQSLIANGEITSGKKLTESYLAEQLGVSRVPIREALRHLLSSGLLVSEPYKGVRVRDFNCDHLKQLYQYRAGLEKTAFTFIWPLRTPEYISELHHRNQILLRAIDTGDSESAIMAEINLHSWCYEIANNSFLLDSWERIKPHIQCYFSLHQRAHSRQGPARESHDNYISLASGDSLSDMLAHIDNHMKQGYNKVLKYLD